MAILYRTVIQYILNSCHPHINVRVTSKLATSTSTTAIVGKPPTDFCYHCSSGVKGEPL